MKKFSEMDIALMHMQLLGDDKMMYGNSNHGDTIEELVNETIKDLQIYLEKNKDSISEKSENGFRINIELYKKGKRDI